MAKKTFTLKTGGDSGGIIPLPDGTMLRVEPGVPIDIPEEHAARFAASPDYEAPSNGVSDTAPAGASAPAEKGAKASK